MPRITNKATNTTLPTVAPATTPALTVLLLEVVWVDVGCEETDAVDDGELTTRHELSVESPTVTRSDTPPSRPCESVIENKSCVPD